MNKLALLGLEGTASGTSGPVRVIGIDLGTTNSTVAEITWNPKEPYDLNVRCLDIEQPTDAGHYVSPLVPSAVALVQGREWVGEGAKRLQGRMVELKLEQNRDIFLECKNDIGARRTYFRAPDGYRSAAEIAGKVLTFLIREASSLDSTTISSTVVTVPASFQGAQRADTMRAAQLASIDLPSGALLDEPLAAFLDCLLSHEDLLDSLTTTPKNLFVFDFGGGTCDVAVFRVALSPAGTSLDVSPLAVSRYHRLGGGDIDRAILYEVLLPQLLKQHNLTAFDLTYEEKRRNIEPALLSVAEALKRGLSGEIARLRSFGQYDDADKAAIKKVQPGLYPCKVGTRSLPLQSPSLTAAEFEELLEPFLDQELLYARESEYRLTCSVFAPIFDGLERAGLHARDVDVCVLVGGSSLIPQVATAITACFNQAHVISFPDAESTQVAVARGAAYQALAIALRGRGPFSNVTSDRIGISTQRGSEELIPKGAHLPYPDEAGWAELGTLSVPGTVKKGGTLPLRVELVAGKLGDERRLFAQPWDINGPVTKGEPLTLRYRMDENQILAFELMLPGQQSVSTFQHELESPITNVVNPNLTRVEIDEMEEDLRTGAVRREDRSRKITEIARKYAELSQHDKAISYLENALQILARPDANILNLMGIYHGVRRDYDREERCFREAEAAGGGGVPSFILAWSQYRRRLYSAAKQSIERSLAVRIGGAGLTLAAQIAGALRDPQARDDYLRQAREEFEPPLSLEDWELDWLVTACRMQGDTVAMEAAQAEQRRRTQGKVGPPDSGILPEVRQ